jgi:3-phenylpropionate/trans-cinnamate dioxygenase ferredoxin reductase subunit
MARGGTAVSPRDPDDYAKSYPPLTTANEIVAYAIEVEATAARAYIASVAQYDDRSLALLGAEIGGVEAQHWAVLLAASGANPVPSPIIEVRVGTGARWITLALQYGVAPALQTGNKNHMPSSKTFVIVGGGQAGATAAQTLRDEGFDGRIVLFGEEAVLPYQRPPLTKSYLRGETGFADAAVHDADFYRTREVELQTMTIVDAIDTKASEVRLQTGQPVRYDQLLLATGAKPRRLSVPGSELDGVHYLRSVADADAIRDAITRAPPLVVIGAGWIGAEVAASARQLGAEVAMVAPSAVPLERVLGREVGRVFFDLHAEHGVDLHFGVGVASMEGEERVEGVRLTDGTVVPAGTVVVGVGVEPQTELAAAAGLEVDNGVITNEYLATSVARIYAAGDVANVLYPAYGTRIRLEHWSAALNQGAAAAKNMVGHTVAYNAVPYFFSYQYELGMEYRGWAPDFDEVVFRGDRARREFIAFWLRNGYIAAAMNVNVWGQGEKLEALIRARRPIDRASLTDPGTDLAASVAPST